MQIPDSDSLQADACGPAYKYDSHTRLQLEGKDQMRARGVPSPDEWDAVALTFAEPVSSTPSNFNRVIEYPQGSVYTFAKPLSCYEQLQPRHRPHAARHHRDKIRAWSRRVNAVLTLVNSD